MSELERSLAIVLGAEFITSFAGLSAALARGPRFDIAPADKLYIAIPDSYNLTRKETFLISLLMGNAVVSRGQHQCSSRSNGSTTTVHASLASWR